MNHFYFLAGLCCFLLALAHSYLGERLLFKNKKKTGKLVPTLSNDYWKEGPLRIIWASWHLASIFGICLGVILISVSINDNYDRSYLTNSIILIIEISMILASILVLYATKGKHPAWLVFLLIACFLFFG